MNIISTKRFASQSVFRVKVKQKVKVRMKRIQTKIGKGSKFEHKVNVNDKVKQNKIEIIMFRHKTGNSRCSHIFCYQNFKQNYFQGQDYILEVKIQVQP